MPRINWQINFRTDMTSYFGTLERSNSLHTASYLIAGVARHYTDLLSISVTENLPNIMYMNVCLS